MATKKKTKKKAKETAGKKATPKKQAKKLSKNKKKTAKRKVLGKTARMKAAPKRTAARRKLASTKLAPTRKRVREPDGDVVPLGYSVGEPVSRPGGQSGDLQGLSSIEDADSESVQELIEEGNAFEADVVTGVERAGNAATREVRTREVPEDDVPDEYLDNDR